MPRPAETRTPSQARTPPVVSCSVTPIQPGTLFVFRFILPVIFVWLFIKRLRANAPPADRTQLRRFLGFANFYRLFIQGFSRVVAPLTALTSTLRPFSWTPEAEDAFSALKSLFTSAPVLILPQPSRQFIVEVDASDVGIGAVLSQRSEEPWPSGDIGWRGPNSRS